MAPPRVRRRVRCREEPYMPSYLTKGAKCSVCEDVATGYHYNAITCEGCKGFFRRVYQRETKFVCKGQLPNKQSCPINKNTRNACQKCRLDRCLQVKMDPNLVLDEVKRRAKRGLIEKNRTRKQLMGRLLLIQKSQFRLNNKDKFNKSNNDQTDRYLIKKLINYLNKSFWSIFSEFPQIFDFKVDSTGLNNGQLFWSLVVCKLAQTVLSYFEKSNTKPNFQFEWRPVLLLMAALHGKLDEIGVGNSKGNEFNLNLYTPKINKNKPKLDSLEGRIDFNQDFNFISSRLEELELTFEQIALMAILLIFKQFEQSEAFKPFRHQLLRALLISTIENQSKGDSEEERLLDQWPVILLRLVQLEQMSVKYMVILDFMAVCGKFNFFK